MGGTGTVVATISLAEEAEKEEALNEKLEDLAFTPSAPYAGVVPAYSAGTTYAKGALAQEAGIVYRSQAAGNKANEPKADTDFAHWAPIGSVNYLLVNPDFLHTPALVSMHGYASKPPARSDAAAHASETVEPGEEFHEEM